MIKKTKSEKWRHARNSAEIAWTNEQKSRFEVVATSYGRNKILDEEIKNQEKANNIKLSQCCY